MNILAQGRRKAELMHDRIKRDLITIRCRCLSLSTRSKLTGFLCSSHVLREATSGRPSAGSRSRLHTAGGGTAWNLMHCTVGPGLLTKKEAMRQRPGGCRRPNRRQRQRGPAAETRSAVGAANAVESRTDRVPLLPGARWRQCCEEWRLCRRCRLPAAPQSLRTSTPNLTRELVQTPCCLRA